uniref:Uncharacterized protein n=1 Tax=Oncorhynchus mykiss TaxID=8022 RepID=A0A8C7UK72_ONCMY
VLPFLLIVFLSFKEFLIRDCSRGACYPPMGDLLLGRGRQLHASSTCGLTGSEVFCTPFGQMKCCPCDSRNPSSQLAHTIQDVLSTAGPNRWWQARKDVSPVTVQLDLQNLFQLDNLVLTFKGPRPSALVVERTLDNGNTWQPALYMASDCRSAFPGIAMITPHSLDQTYCYTLPPATTNPYQDQTLSLSTEVSGLSGLRVRLTNLGAVPRLPGRAPSLFYALREMRVMGTCLCHGHANRCLPDTNQLPNTQVSAQCECQHNTAGINCERCADLYNDLPWRPAEEGDTHTCKRCECNNHSQRCRFDPDVYESSGRRSGGMCESCLHHTTGPKCDRCAPGYQPNHRSSCHCSAEGVENGDQCDDVTGSCRCKANVDGSQCDRCKMGYYGLTASNPLGCNSPCRCDPTNSHGDTCDQSTGQCQCRSGFGGRTCTECPDNTYGDPLIGCRCKCPVVFCHRNLQRLLNMLSCQCAAGGTKPGGCDKRTGACRCRLGVTGARCDACTRGHCDSFPDCEVCPSCFFSLDSNIQNLTLGLERLSSRIPSLPGGSLPTSLGPRIRTLEATLTQIRDSLPLPPPSARQVSDALSQLRRLRWGMFRCPGKLRMSKCFAFQNLSDAYDESTDSAKSVDATLALTLTISLNPALNPALTVCGSVRFAPCTPAQCDGELCPAEGAPPCGRGESCVGALPQGTRAVRHSPPFSLPLPHLSSILSSSIFPSISSLPPSSLSLSPDPSSDPTHISTVSEWILNAKLPVSLATLKRKLQEIRDLAAGLPDSTAVLDQAGPQLDIARRLLQEARDARYNTL